jgi:hypothetical protein
VGASGFTGCFSSVALTWDFDGEGFSCCAGLAAASKKLVETIAAKFLMYLS